MIEPIIIFETDDGEQEIYRTRDGKRFFRTKDGKHHETEEAARAYVVDKVCEHLDGLLTPADVPNMTRIDTYNAILAMSGNMEKCEDLYNSLKRIMEK